MDMTTAQTVQMIAGIITAIVGVACLILLDDDALWLPAWRRYGVSTIGIILLLGGVLLFFVAL